MNSKQPDRIFVSKEFKTFFKVKAAKEGMSIIDYSTMIAKNPNKLLKGEKTDIDKKKKPEGGKLFESFF